MKDEERGLEQYRLFRHVTFEMVTILDGGCLAPQYTTVQYNNKCYVDFYK